MNRSFCFVQLYHISQAGGGAEVQTHYLSRELVKRGFDVHYICKNINFTKENQNKIINGVKVHWLNNKPTHNISNIKSIENKLNEIKPDFIIERMSSAFGQAIINYKKNNNAKYIWICTDNISCLKYKNLYSSYQKLNLIKFLYSIIRSIRIDLIRQKSIKCSDTIFYQNDIQKEMIIRNFNRKPLKIISGHPCVMQKESSGNNFENKIVLWCANFGKHKRPEIFIDLSKRFEQTNFKFIMVGGHPNQTYVEALLKDKSKNVKITGKISFKESLKYFNQASLLVNTSISEGFSNTYIQAWLNGIPTIVMGADPDGLIKMNQLGYNCKSINSMVHKVESLLNDKNSYSQMSKHVKCYAEKNHSIKVMSDHFLKSINL